MVSVSPYFSDKTVIQSIRKYFNSDEQYSINFKYYLNFAVNTDDGILIKIKDRKFLVDYYSGIVIKEVR